jgi:inner membrane protein
VATILTHPAVAVALSPLVPAEKRTRMFWRCAIYLTVIPDLDVLGFPLGVRYSDFWGHRGFTHSLAFAAILAPVASRLCKEKALSLYSLLFFVLGASHGALDALTDGGLGIAFFSPIDNARYFFPWTPMPVSPIGGGFFSAYGMKVLTWELAFVWLPCLLAFAALRRPK